MSEDVTEERRGSAAALRPAGALDMLDRALLVVRRRGIEPAVRAWAGGFAVAFVLLAIYYLERVEGIAGLRPVFAMALVLAWWIRSWVLAGVARGDVQHIWSGVSIPDKAGRFVDVARTSSVVLLGLWVWMWLVVGASYIGSVAVAFVVPVLCLRGMVAPSWIARAGCTADGGLRELFRAAGDSSGRRVAGAMIEFFVLVGALALFVDLWMMVGLVIVLGRALLGIEVAFVEAFLSFRNNYFLLAMAISTLVLIEPLRAAISSVLWVDGRVRQEGLDLRAAVDEAIASTRSASSDEKGSDAEETAGTGGGKGVQTAATVLLACAIGLGAIGLGAVPAQAQGASSEEQPAQVDASDDEAVQRSVEDILSGSEFREYEDDRGKTLREAIERLVEWLFEDSMEVPEAEPMDVPSIPAPPAGFFVVLGVLLALGVAVYLIATRARDRQPSRSASGGEEQTDDPRERAPSAHLDDAALLASQGRYREALRSLYVATLVALDRRGQIAFDPHLTNWQYMRQMPRGQTRDEFREFTRLFDYKWYGDEPTHEQDYLHVRRLADHICGTGEGGAPESAPAGEGRA